MSEEYLEPISVVEEAFAEVHKDVKANACRIAIQKNRRDRVKTSFMQICVGGQPSMKPEIFNNITYDNVQALTGQYEEREMEYYSQYSGFSLDALSSFGRRGVDEKNQVNMNLVNVTNAGLIYLGFEDVSGFGDWKKSTEFDYLRYIKPWLKGKLIFVYTGSDADIRIIMNDPFFEGLSVENFYGYYHMIRQTNGIVNLEEMPYYVNGYIQEYVFDKTSIDTLSTREVPSFVDAMTPVPYVDEEGELQNLLVGQTEITQGLYEYVMGENPSDFRGSGQLPVENVNWFDLLEFCNRLSEMQGFRPCYSNIDEDAGSADWDRSANGYRLPTEHEWEYIAKANRGFEYSGSDDLGNVAWYGENSGEQTRDVGEKKENSFGTYDQSGNLEEWCWDLHSPPRARRVLRGGGWYDVSAALLRAADRLLSDPSCRRYFRGGRVLRSPDPTEPLTQ